MYPAFGTSKGEAMPKPTGNKTTFQNEVKKCARRQLKLTGNWNLG